MTRKNWTLAEKEIVVKAFLESSNKRNDSLAQLIQVLLGSFGYPFRERSEIKALINDIKRVSRGKLNSHIAKSTIIAYENCLIGENNPLLQNYEEIIPLLSEEEGPEEYSQPVKIITTIPLPSNQFLTNYLTNNPLLDENDVLEEPFTKTLERLITYIEWDRKPPITWSTAYQSAELDHNTAREITLGNRVKKQSLLKLIIGMQLDFERAVLLLAKANFRLTRVSFTDIIVARALKSNNYNRKIINDAILQRGEPPLFPKLAKALHQI